jgi:hypothetical protein
MSSALDSRAQVLNYSTYLNGVGRFAVNASGEACATDWPNPIKINKDGTVIYFNKLFLPALVSVGIDSQGNCYVAGTGQITPTAGAFQSLPRSAGSFQFVVKFDGSGNVVYATYLGGSGEDFPVAIAVDETGNVYVTGYTRSNDFPTLNAFQKALASAQDAFISVLNATGTGLLFSTYWGGTADDQGAGIAVDSSGNTYITGTTYSTDFPVVAAFQGTFEGAPGTGEAFVIKLDRTGQPIYATYLGGSGGVGDSGGYAVSADAVGSAYVAGLASAGMPVVNPIQSTTTDTSTFLTKFTPDGSALIYSTYLGEMTDVAGIAVDALGRTFVAGTVSAGPPQGSVPLASPIQNTFYAGLDGYVSVLDATGSALLFSTYLGADHAQVLGLGVDADANVYVAGGATGGFPITNPSNGIYVPLTLVTYKPYLILPEPNAQYYAMKIGPGTGSSFSYPTTVDLRPSATPVGIPLEPVSVLLANTSATGSVGITNIAIQGDFSQTNNCPKTLGAATRCELQLTFSPTVAGNRTGTITITDTAPGSPHVINLIGTGVTPQVQLSPTSLTFEGQVVGTTSTSQIVTLTSASIAPLTISRVSVSGDFAESNDCGSLPGPTTSCQITVVFSPMTTGSRTGTLTIVDNAPDSPQTVNLAGTALAPGLGLRVAPGNPDTATITAGQQAGYVLTIGGAGIGGNAILSCSGAPAGATCSVPASQLVDAKTQASFNVSVMTTPITTGTRLPKELDWLWSSIVVAGLTLGSSARRKRSKSSASRCWLLAVLFPLLLMCSCGGGSQAPNGTPPGTYHLTVSAAVGSSTQSTSLTLIVQ